MDLLIFGLVLIMSIRLIFSLRKENDHLSNIVRISSVILILMIAEYQLHIDRKFIIASVVIIFLYWIFKILKIVHSMLKLMDNYDEFNLDKSISNEYKIIIFDFILTTFLLFAFSHWIGLIDLIGMS